MKLANLPQVLQLHSLAAVDETAKKKVEPQQSLNHPAIPSQPATPQPASPANGQPNGSAYANAPAQPAATTQQATPQQSAPQHSAPQQAAPSRLKSTVSLTQSLTPPAQQPTKQNNAEPSVDYAAVPNGAKKEELTLANLQRFWYEFSQKRLQAGNSTTEQITLNREIQLNGTTIEIALDNDHQQDAVMNMRYELLGFLKARLDAPKLDINPRVAPQEVNRLPYTPAEKFNFLAEKNPYLLELKQALGLDVDF